MKILSIQFHNYRPFFGTTPTVNFSSQESRNTTILFGNNGTGKTAILNGFTWTLYKKFTPALDSPEELVNKQAIAQIPVGERVEGWVKVTFEHAGKKYLAQRYCGASKTDNVVVQDQGDLTLLVETGGRWARPTQAPKDIINRILPENLHRYFFFDGERIENFVQIDKKAEMAAATKLLLGLEVLERSVRHLGDAKKELENEHQNIAPPETSELIAEKKQLKDKKLSLEERQNEIIAERQNQELLDKKLSEQLATSENVEELQKQRDKLQQDEKSANIKINEGKKKLRKLVSTKAYNVFLTEATAEVQTIFDGLRKKGELPTDVKQQFIKDLLDQQTCICGTHLEPGNQAYSYVETWMNRAGRKDVEETAMQMSAQVKSIDQKIDEFWKNIDDEQNNQEEQRKRLSSIEDELEEIHEQLKNSPIEDVRKLELRLSEIKNKIREFTLEEGENINKINGLDSEIKKKENLYKTQQLNEKKQILARERVQVAEESIDRLRKFRDLLDTNFREELEQIVQKIFRQISFKNYLPQLNDKYELTLIEESSGKKENVAPSILYL